MEATILGHRKGAGVVRDKIGEEIEDVGAGRIEGAVAHIMEVVVTEEGGTGSNLFPLALDMPPSYNRIF